MNRKVLGKNIHFELKIGVDYYRIFCGKTAYLDINQKEIEVTYVNSGDEEEYVPGMSNATINIVGLTLINNDEGKISINYLIANKRTIGEWRIRQTDQDGTTYQTTFSAFLTNANISRDVTQWSQSSVTLRVSGGFTNSTTIDPPGTPVCEIADPIYKDLAEGALFVSDALLIPGAGETITILHVSRSGTTYYETAGSPGNLEFQYNSTLGRIIFQTAGNPASPDLEPVSIEYKVET